MPNFMKFYRVVLEKHAHFREGRDGEKSSIHNFCSTAQELHSVGFSQPWWKSCKIPVFFTSWNFLMYSSNKQLKPSTACVIVRRKKHMWNRYRTNKLSLYQCHVCLFFCNLYVRTALHQHERAQKKFCVQPP